jgi:hypothetical protein
MKIARLSLLVLMLMVSTAAANLGSGNFGGSLNGLENNGCYFIECDNKYPFPDGYCCEGYYTCLNSYVPEFCAEHCGGPC